MAASIKYVEPGSPAARAGIQAGETLLSIGGHPIRDVLDYKFYGYDARVTLEVSDAAGVKRTVALRKPEGMDPGLEFETYLMDQEKRCANRCVFCFIDQLPKGMRDTLYFKDDDARMSFLIGNYITMTNLSDADAKRIIDMHVSPLNISVHTTDPQLRDLMLGNRRGGDSLRYLYDFAKAGLRLQTQIVVCPGLNDGAALEKTLADLSALHPAVESVAVVPVGLSRHREGLYPLRPVEKQDALDILNIIDAARERNLQQFGEPLCFAADELYNKAELPMPGREYYDERFSQLENGIGLMRLFEEELTMALRFEEELGTPEPLTVITGVEAAPFMERMLSLISEKCDKLDYTVLPIRNDFFGESITVAGLLTGRDIIAQASGKVRGTRVLLPIVTLRHGENVLLDDVTVPQLTEALGVPVLPVEIDGGLFLDTILQSGKED